MIFFSHLPLLSAPLTATTAWAISPAKMVDTFKHFGIQNGFKLFFQYCLKKHLIALSKAFQCFTMIMMSIKRLTIVASTYM